MIHTHMYLYILFNSYVHICYFFLAMIASSFIWMLHFPWTSLSLSWKRCILLLQFFLGREVSMLILRVCRASSLPQTPCNHPQIKSAKISPRFSCHCKVTPHYRVLIGNLIVLFSSGLTKPGSFSLFFFPPARYLYSVWFIACSTLSTPAGSWGLTEIWRASFAVGIANELPVVRF